jgi:hypothetical protein
MKKNGLLHKSGNTFSNYNRVLQIKYDRNRDKKYFRQSN